MDFTPLDNPITNINWRRHRRGCPHYRERWFTQSDLQVDQPMYQVFCGMNTPPNSVEEQEKCLSSKTRCWRLENRTTAGEPIPVSSIKRRRPA